MRLSALVTLMGRVSETRWVDFLGRRKRWARLKSGGGVEPERRRLRVSKRIGSAISGMARHAAFVQTLREVGFPGPLNVEREAEDQAQRLRDIADGIVLLRSLAGG